MKVDILHMTLVLQSTSIAHSTIREAGLVELAQHSCLVYMGGGGIMMGFSGSVGSDAYQILQTVIHFRSCMDFTDSLFTNHTILEINL